MMALSVDQPVPWAIVHAGCRVLNMPMRAPMPECPECGGSGSVDYSMDLHSEIETCGDCWGSGTEALRLLLHAGSGYETEWFSTHGRAPHRPSWLPLDMDPDHVDWAMPLSDEDAADPPGNGDWWTMVWDAKYLNAIVAVVEITGSHEDSGDIRYEGGAPVCNDPRMIATCSPWAAGGTWRSPMHHWQVGDVVKLDTPVPCVPTRSIRDMPDGSVEFDGIRQDGLWTPPRSVLDAVEAQL